MAAHSNSPKASTIENEDHPSADASSLFDDKPVLLMEGDKTGSEIKWHKDIPEWRRTSPWVPMATSFVLGCLCIKALSRPSYVRRRIAVLGTLSTYIGYSQYMRTHAAMRENTQRHFQDTLPNGRFPPEIDPWTMTPADLLEAGCAGSLADAERMWQTMWLIWPCELYNVAENAFFLQRRKNHRALLKTLRNEAFVAPYLERDRHRSSELGLQERLGVAWRKVWSSVESRATVEGSLLVPVLRGGAHGAFTDQDVGRCSTFFADLLESEDIREDTPLARAVTASADNVFKGAVFAGLLFPTRWVLWPAGVAGLCALAWCVPPGIRWVQNNEEHLRYSTPAAGALLHSTAAGTLLRVEAAFVSFFKEREAAERERQARESGVPVD